MMKRLVQLFFRRVILSSQGLPIILILSALGVLLVFYRMNSVEQDYKINDIDKMRKSLQSQNRELKAKKARLLSIKNLQKMADQHGLQRPQKNQIIIIP